MNRDVSSKLVATQFKSVHQDLSGPFREHEKKQKEALAEMRELALSVTDAFLTINPDSRHWSYAVVNFQNCLVTLDDLLGMPAIIFGIKQ